MKKLFLTLALLGTLFTNVFAKQYVVCQKINMFLDFSFLSYQSDAQKCAKVIQEYIDKGYRIVSASYDYEQGVLLLVYEDDK